MAGGVAEDPHDLVAVLVTADLLGAGLLRDRRGGVDVVDPDVEVLLGSDFPSIPYPYAHQLQALHRLDLGEDWLRAVLWHNGARLFRIEA